jgi:hypothetical protein
MKLYLVHGIVRTPNSVETVFRWCGTQAECTATRKEFIERGASKYDTHIKEIEVPTNKAGLLEFLNKGQHVGGDLPP